MSTPETGRVTIPLHKPDLKEMLFFLSSGVIVSVPLSFFFETLGDSLSSQLGSDFPAVILSIVVLAPFIEEFAKAYPLFYRHGETQRSVFTLGYIVGLGFGIVEFLEYVFIVGVPFYIRLPGILFHASNTAIVAYGISTKRTLPFYLMATALHASINLSGLFDPYRPLVVVVLTATLLISWYLYQRTSERFIEY
jgi:RsiW-degrading membrane proteinase PrsW (M82 family)